MKAVGIQMPLFVDDFVGGTLAMGADEIGAYTLLLLYQWSNGYIEADQQAIERIARCEYAKLRRVLAKFDRDANGNLVNRRCEQVRTERIRFLEKQRLNSAKGADARRAQSNPRNIPTDTPRSNPRVIPLDNPVGTPTGNPKQTPSSSSSSSSYSSPSVADGGAGGDESPNAPPSPPAKRQKPVGFKAWTAADFVEQVNKANEDGLLDPPEVEDFVAYWTEPSASGRLRFSLEQTWDTRRRMQTAIRVIFAEQRRRSGYRSPAADPEHAAI